MSLKSINPTTTTSWELLNKHFEAIKDVHMSQWFTQNNDRANQMTIKWEDFYIDYSKNRITEDTLELLLKLADETKLKEAIDKYFSGAFVS